MMFAACLAARPGASALSQTTATPPSSAAQQFAETRRAEIAQYTARLQSFDEEDRREAALMLGAMRDAATAPVLTTALADKAERVRAAALAGLGLLNDPALVPLIANSLLKDKSPFVRKTAAYGLGQTASREAVPPLITALRDKDMEVRGATVVALSKIPDAAAIAPLIQALADKSSFVRAYAAAALGANGRSAASAVPGLIKLLTTDDGPEARRQAATALGLIGEPAARPALERAERSADPYLSQAAREAIALIKK